MNDLKNLGVGLLVLAAIIGLGVFFAYFPWVLYAGIAIFFVWGLGGFIRDIVQEIGSSR